MEKQLLNTEQKAILKTGVKFLDKVNPNTPYQHKLKSDIKYTINSLSVDDIELWIACTKFFQRNIVISSLSEDSVILQKKLFANEVNYGYITT